MIGPFVQGFLLVGVIYWYSKGMLTLINDYYRDEFKNYLAKDPKKELFLKTKQPDENPPTKNIDLSPKVEGLPDILNPEGNSICRAGIVSRGVETVPVAEPMIPSLNKHDSNSEGKLQQIGKSSDEEAFGDREGCSNTGSLLDSNEFNYASASCHGDSTLNEKPILNPSVGNKLNYEQITNQQVPIINDDDKSTSTAGTMESVSQAEKGASNGNCHGNRNVGCCKKKSLSGPPRPSVVVADAIDKQKHYLTASSSLLQVEPIWHTSCRRKSVTEMIQFWSNFEQNAPGND